MRLERVQQTSAKYSTQSELMEFHALARELKHCTIADDRPQYRTLEVQCC